MWPEIVPGNELGMPVDWDTQSKYSACGEGNKEKEFLCMSTGCKDTMK